MAKVFEVDYRKGSWLERVNRVNPSQQQGSIIKSTAGYGLKCTSTQETRYNFTQTLYPLITTTLTINCFFENKKKSIANNQGIIGNKGQGSLGFNVYSRCDNNNIFYSQSYTDGSGANAPTISNFMKGLHLVTYIIDNVSSTLMFYADGVLVNTFKGNKTFGIFVANPIGIGSAYGFGAGNQLDTFYYFRMDNVIMTQRNIQNLYINLLRSRPQQNTITY